MASARDPTNNLNGQTCVSLGYDYGTLTCSASCTFVTSACKNASCTLSQGFEGTVMPPTDWQLVQENQTQTWKFATFAHSGSKSAIVEYDSNLQQQDEVLISHPIECNNMSITFWQAGSKYWCCDTYHNYEVALWVVVGDWDGDTPNDDWVITSTLLTDGFAAGCKSTVPVPFQYCQRT